MKKKLIDFLLLNLGVALVSIGVYFFKFPNNFTTGGVTGISIIISSIFDTLTPGILVAAINILLMLVGFIVLGKGFGAKTCYATLMFSAQTWLLEKVLPMSSPFTDEPLLELVFAILLPAVGSALLFNINASTGGTDVVAMILKKYTSMNIGKALFISDAIIAASSLLVFDIKTGLFSIIGLLTKASLIDSVIESINLCKYFTVVTTKPDEVCQYILQNLKHGATKIKAVGAYSNDDKSVILTVCRRSEALALKKQIKNIDTNAFIFISNTSEIIGKGFRATT